MATRVFVDTNMLVYAYDTSEPEKQRRAAEVLDLLQAIGIGVLSVQILSEFFVVARRKFVPPMDVAEVSKVVERYLQSWRVLSVTPAMIPEAIRGVRDHQLAYWDALVWAAARLNQVSLVLSEDFQHDRTVEGVTFLNPFLPEFSIDALTGLAN